MRTLATLHALLPAARLHGDAGTRIARSVVAALLARRAPPEQALALPA